MQDKQKVLRMFVPYRVYSMFQYIAISRFFYQQVLCRVGSLDGHIEDNWTMVTTHHILPDHIVTQIFLQLLRQHKVVQTPEMKEIAILSTARLLYHHNDKADINLESYITRILIEYKNAVLLTYSVKFQQYRFICLGGVYLFRRSISV